MATRTKKSEPIAPYMAVGLSTVVHGIGSRKDIDRNLDIIEDAIHAAVSIIGINMPVRMIALAEGALTGFTDEIFDIPHVVAARELFIDLPGPETERLAGLAKLYNTYIVVQCKARWPEVMPDRFFNMLFVISPQGEIVHKAAKNHLWCRERSCTPHDVYDRWVELFGDGIDAFYPVLRTTDIGNIGTICCSDGEYPEAVRALAFNGAEVVYRPSEAVPMTLAKHQENIQRGERVLVPAAPRNPCEFAETVGLGAGCNVKPAADGTGAASINGGAARE